VALEVLSSSRRTWTWVALWLFATCWLAIGTLHATATLAEKRRVERDGGVPPRPWLAVLLGGFAVGTFYVVARPIGMVTGWFDDASQVAITGALLALAGATAYAMAGRPRPDPIPGTITPMAATVIPDYRTHLLRIDDEGWRRSVATLEGDRRLRVRTIDDGVSVGYAGRRGLGDSWVALRRNAGDETKLAASFNDSVLLFEVARMLVGPLGRLRLDLERGGALFTYEVDADTDLDAVVDAFRTGQRERLALQRVRASFLELLASRAERQGASER